VDDDRTGRLDPGEDLGDADLRNRNGDLNRHVGGDAKAAILVGNLALRVGMGGRYQAAQHDQGNTHHAEDDSPRRSRTRRCDFAQHPTNIAQAGGKWEVTAPEPARMQHKLILLKAPQKQGGLGNFADGVTVGVGIEDRFAEEARG